MRRAILFLFLFVFLITGCTPKTQQAPSCPSPTLSFKPAEPFSTAYPKSDGTMLPLVPGWNDDPLTAEDGIYTLCWLSDTQYYSQNYPWIFHSMTAFLKTNAQRMNLKYIMHTGDMINNMNDEEQWDTAVESLARIDSIPMGILAGNHDIGNDDTLDYTDWCKRFGKSYTAGKSWFGGSYENNRGHYDCLELGNTSYLFVYMGYAPDEDCINWVNGVFRENPDKVGVLLLHEYFDTDGALTDTGEVIFSQVVEENSNLYMVLSGHRYAAYLRTDEIDDDNDGKPDRTVHQMIANYQKNPWGGAGYMRFFQVDEKKGEIHVLTYSPYKDDFNYYDPKTYPGKDEFTLKAKWLGPAKPDSGQ